MIMDDKKNLKKEWDILRMITNDQLVCHEHVTNKNGQVYKLCECKRRRMGELLVKNWHKSLRVYKVKYVSGVNKKVNPDNKKFFNFMKFWEFMTGWDHNPDYKFVKYYDSIRNQGYGFMKKSFSVDDFGDWLEVLR